MNKGETILRYFATYDLPGAVTDLLSFDSRAARDAWVNFSDEFSRETNTTSDNCTFGRKAIEFFAPEDMRFVESIICRCDHVETIPNAVVYCGMWLYIEKCGWS